MTKVLIIEDERGIREAVVDTLEFAGYDVADASNGREGVKTALQFKPDLILCDVMMPELDGYGVLLELNEHPKLSRTPFIFITAKAALEDIRQGMVMGADDYLTKPFKSQDLLEAVETRLNRHKQLAEANTEQIEALRQYLNLTLPHELRTPLTGILGYLYMVQDGLDDMEKPTIRTMLERAQSSADRLGKLIENFIAYSQVRLIANDPEIREKIRGHSIFKDTADNLQQIAEKEAHQAQRIADLDISVEEATTFIFFDHATKLFSSLINNAFKFSQRGTKIKVQARVDSNSYLITIEDEGRGMTAAQLARIEVNNQFERDEYEQQGAGLGLVIAKHIVEIYDGEFNIESKPSIGTTVSIRLHLA